MNRTFRPKLKKENDKKEIEELQKRMDSLEKILLVQQINYVQYYLMNQKKNL